MSFLQEENNAGSVAVEVMRVNIPSRVLLAESAWQRIQAYCASSTDLETGGLLVGRRIQVEGKPFIVAIFAGGPGPQADRRSDEFAPDSEAQQLELEQVRASWQESGIKIDYLGTWHKHPAHFKQLSSGDIRQAHEILADADYCLTWNELILPIVIVSKQQVKLFPYYIAQFHPQPVLIEWESYPDEVLRDLLLEF